MVKFVQQMAILKSLVRPVLVVLANIAEVYAKNIHLSVILNVVTMIQAWSIQIQINVQSHQMNPHHTLMTQHVQLQLKMDVII